MTDDHPPKKKSRFFKRITSPFTSTKKETLQERQRTPPQQTVVPGSQQLLVPQLQLSNLSHGFIQQSPPSCHGTRLAPPAQLQVDLVSPRTATANAFQKLSVEDHTQLRKPSPPSCHGSQAQKTSKDATSTAHLQSPETAQGQSDTEGHRDSSPTPLILVTPKQARFINDGSQIHNAGRGAAEMVPAGMVKLPPIIIRTATADSPAPTTKPDQDSHIGRRHRLPQAQATELCSPGTLLARVKIQDNVNTGPQLPPEGFRPKCDIRHPGTVLPGKYYNRDARGKLQPDTPPNLYTSREYVEYMDRNMNPPYISPKKRKLDDMTGRDILPPLAYIYHRTGNPSFNVFHGFLLYPELCYQLAMHLPLNDLISLYAISKDYHIILDTRFTTLIVSIAEYLTPTAARVFHYRSYAHLCRRDPAARIPHPDPKLAALGIARKVPSFRWLKMLLHREKVVHEIMALSAQRGVPFPKRCKEVFLKFWYILDIPNNGTRIGYVHNPRLLSDLDLYFGMCIMVKLDMLFNDPVGAEKRDGSRRLILSQRSLTPLLLVLKREIWKTKIEILQEWIKLRYEPSARDRDECEDTGIMGVPLHECGMLKHQYWGDSRKLAELREEARKQGKRDVDWLLRPDQMVIREAVRRGLQFKGHVLRCVLYGYVDMRTLSDLKLDGEGRDVGRREKGLDMHGEYDFDDLAGGAESVDTTCGGDPLLDLGRKNVASRRCGPEEMGEQERRWRSGEREFVQQCYAWWRNEIEDAGVDVGNLNGWEGG